MGEVEDRMDVSGRQHEKQQHENRAYTLRMLEDRVLRLETVAGGLSDRYETLRTEMRHEILFPAGSDEEP
ncbi:hypothetical protein [Gluconobacter morbifer]|nr:hypothetical protein [Gluconobacter morbifer]